MNKTVMYIQHAVQQLFQFVMRSLNDPTVSSLIASPCPADSVSLSLKEKWHMQIKWVAIGMTLHIQSQQLHIQS